MAADGTRTGHLDLRQWQSQAIEQLQREALRSADTHLLQLCLPEFPQISFYLKDESTHPSGSLKHRLARSLFLYALCNNRLRPGQTVVDASSGSTAISEAWFARLLGLPFVAVMPDCTASAKVAALQQLGARCLLLPVGADTAAAASEFARTHQACYLDQFGLAERATDWRGNNNIAESILRQLAAEPDPQPEWIVCGVGTGGTSATIGRYLRYRGWPTRLCVAEPSGAAFAQAYQAGGCRDALASRATIIEGVGRARVEPGFQFEIVDRVEEIDDADSVIGMRDLEALLGRRYGGSSGCNWIACLRLAAELRQRGLGGSIVTLLGDSGERYADTLYDNAWLQQRGHDLMSAQKRLSDLKSAR